MNKVPTRPLETRPGHCPACDVEVEYEVEGSSASCPVCGRTHSVALRVARSRRARRNERRLKLVLLSVSAVVLAAMVLPGFVLGPEQLAGTLVRAGAGLFGLLLFVGLLWGLWAGAREIVRMLRRR